uniref:Uncharacterized protein n=1 Tax=Anguilla anguilla TaxID=7936 RepID=A0A0E9U384_ANGAN
MSSSCPHPETMGLIHKNLCCGEHHIIFNWAVWSYLACYFKNLALSGPV